MNDKVINSLHNKILKYMADKVTESEIMAFVDLKNLQAKYDKAIEMIITLVKLCDIPRKDYDKVFCKLHIGAGDYMGSGYAFVDAFNRIWGDFLEDGNENLYIDVIRGLEESE